jgi:NAD-dependent SIR2 family protein deacetylase
MVSPHSVHYASTELEVNFNAKFLLITQHINNLREKVGSKDIIFIS